MNTSISQTKSNDLQYGISHCKKTFISSGEPVVNSYKCNQKQFATSDMWGIQKQRKQITIGQGITLI